MKPLSIRLCALMRCLTRVIWIQLLQRLSDLQRIVLLLWTRGRLSPQRQRHRYCTLQAKRRYRHNGPWASSILLFELFLRARFIIIRGTATSKFCHPLAAQALARQHPAQGTRAPTAGSGCWKADGPIPSPNWPTPRRSAPPTSASSSGSPCSRPTSSGNP